MAHLLPVLTFCSDKENKSAGQFSEKKRTRSSARRETASDCDTTTFKNATRSPKDKDPFALTSTNAKSKVTPHDAATSPLNYRTTAVKEPNSVTHSDVQSFNQQPRSTAAKN